MEKKVRVLSKFNSLKDRFLQKGSYLSNIVLVSSTNLLSSLIVLATTPVLARLFSPEVYGFFAIFTSICTVFSFVLALSYDNAIIYVVERYKERLLLATTWVIVVTTLITTLFLFFFRDWFFQIFKIESILNYWFLIPIFIFFDRIKGLLNSFFIRLNKFGKVTFSDIVRNISARMIAITGGFFLSGSVIYLLTSSIVAVILSIIILLISFKTEKIEIFKAISFNKIKHVLGLYIQYPKFILPSGLFNLLNGNLPLLIFAAYYSKNELGNLSYSYSLLAIPIAYVGNAIGKAFSQKGVESYQDSLKTLSGVYVKSYRAMLKLSLPLFLFVAIFGEFLFEFFFGGRWQLAGKYAQIVSILYLIRMLNVPFFPVFRILRKEQLILYYNVGVTFISALAIYLTASFNYSLKTTLWVYVIINTIVLLLINIYISQLLKLKLRMFFIYFTLVISSFLAAYVLKQFIL